MSDNVRQIAQRIKELREIVGDTPEQVARDLGLSLEKYLSYESGETDLSISFICEIANRFQVEVSTLMTGEDPKLRIYSLVKKGQGVTVERLEEYKYESLAENFLNKKTQPFLVTVEPDVANTPISLNSHDGQEFDYIIEGTLLISINGREMELNEGDCIYFDSSHSHGMKAIGNKPTKFLAVVIP
ncbi:XRE family transcriptional regulator [Clostridia bacterium OttesenSCG-928-F22]|nr:XRE family transcriptional regulator [Clostridia bacterium OttesenSCG-928-F22]